MRKYLLSSGTLGRYYNQAMEEAIRRHHFNTFEFSAPLIEDNSPKGLENIERCKHMLADGAMFIGSNHIPFGTPYDPSAADESDRKRNVEAIKTIVMKCVDGGFGSPHYTLHGSMEPLRDDERAYRISQSRKSIAELAPFFAGLKANVNIENLPRTCGGNCVEEIQEMVRDQADNVGITFDVNHWMARAEQLPDMIRALAPRIRSFHLSDYDGVDEQHWGIPHRGVIEWHGVMATIKELKQDINMIFEAEFHGGVDWRGNTKLDSAITTYEYSAYYLENIEKFEYTDNEFKSFRVPGNK